MSDIKYSVQPDVVTNITGSPNITLKSCVDNVMNISYNSINGNSLSNLYFDLTPPSNEAVLDPNLTLMFPCQFVLRNGNGSTDWADQYDAWPDHKAGFAQFPIAKIMTGLTMTINGQTLERLPNKYLHALSHYCDLDHPAFIGEYGTPDQTPIIGEFDAVELGGSPQNAVANYGWAGKFGTRRNRNVIPYFTDENGVSLSATSATPYVKVFENLYMTIPLSLFNVTGEQQGIAKIKSLTISMTCDLYKAAEMLSIHSSVPIGNVKIIPWTNTPTLRATWKTPQDYILDAAPKKCLYPITTIPEVFETSSTLLGKTYGKSETYGPIGLTSVPSKIYIFAARDLTGLSDHDKMAFGTAFAQINSITLNYNGLSTQLTGLSSYELWKMSVKNGYIHDFDNFYHGVGSVVCIDVAKDLTMRDFFIGESGDMNGNNMLTVSAFMLNRNDSGSFKVCIVPVYDKILSISDDVTEILDSYTLTESDKRGFKMEVAKELKSRDRVVGGFFGAIFNGIKSLFGGSVTAGNTIAGSVIAGAFRPAVCNGYRSLPVSGGGMRPATGGSVQRTIASHPVYDEDDDDPYSRLG